MLCHVGKRRLGLTDSQETGRNIPVDTPRYRMLFEKFLKKSLTWTQNPGPLSQVKIIMALSRGVFSNLRWRRLNRSKAGVPGPG
jgi:hypothetical protein